MFHLNINISLISPCVFVGGICYTLWYLSEIVCLIPIHNMTLFCAIVQDNK